MIRFISILLLAATVASCQKELGGDGNPAPGNASYTLNITFRHRVDTNALQLGTTYTNPHREPYTITAFKYYISNIILQPDAGAPIHLPNTYYLINEAEPGSKTVSLSVSHNHFSGISFLLGVDSARNVSGTQSGSLDPARGMFWTWNSGYIMAKLEANSPLAGTPANKVEYHIGGFRTGQNSLRSIQLPFPPGQPVHIASGKASEIVIDANANTWFAGVHNLTIANHPVITSPGLLAGQMADNYAKMFTISAIHN